MTERLNINGIEVIDGKTVEITIHQLAKNWDDLFMHIEFIRTISGAPITDWEKGAGSCYLLELGFEDGCTHQVSRAQKVVVGWNIDCTPLFLS